jgi:hypothetical protein
MVYSMARVPQRRTSEHDPSRASQDSQDGLHPLEGTQVGERVLFYPEAEEILAKTRDVGFQCAAEVPRWNLCALERHAH